MRLKKNFLSLLSWGVLLVLTGYHLCTYFFSIEIGSLAQKWKAVTVIAVVAFLYCVYNGIYLLIQRLRKASIEKKQVQTQDKRRGWLEGIFVFLLLLVFAAVRILMVMNQGDTKEFENAIFQMSKVAPEYTPFYSGSSLNYLFVALLHTLFSFVGNWAVAGIVFQMFLLMAAMAFLYLAVKNMAGRMTATVVLLSNCFLPVFVKSALVLAPENLYLLLYSVGFYLVTLLWSIAETEQVTFGDYCWVILAGGYAGFLVYLEVASAVLFVIVIASFYLKKGVRKNALTCCIIWLMAVANGLLLSFFIDSLTSGINMLTILQKWSMDVASGWGYQGGAFRLEQNLILQILFTGFIWIPAFSVSKEETEGYSANGFILLVLMIFFLFGKCQGNEAVLLSLHWVIGAGIGLASFFYVEEKREILPVWEEMPMTDMEKKEENTTVENTTEKDETEENKSKPTVELIPNVLPGPRKHVKKTMDYKIQVPDERLHFDLEVSEQDDYDRS